MYFLGQLVADKELNINCRTKATTGNTPLLELCRRAMESLFPLLKIILANERVEVNFANRFGHTALLLACQYYHGRDLISCVSLLIKHGIDATAKCKMGDALLVLCRNYRKKKDLKLFDIIRLLLKQGISLESVQKSGKILEKRGFLLDSKALKATCDEKLHATKVRLNYFVIILSPTFTFHTHFNNF